MSIIILKHNLVFKSMYKRTRMYNTRYLLCTFTILNYLEYIYNGHKQLLFKFLVRLMAFLNHIL